MATIGDFGVWSPVPLPARPGAAPPVAPALPAAPPLGPSLPILAPQVLPPADPVQRLALIGSVLRSYPPGSPLWPQGWQILRSLDPMAEWRAPDELVLPQFLAATGGRVKIGTAMRAGEKVYPLVPSIPLAPTIGSFGLAT